MDLKSQDVDCFGDNFFAGALCYADVLVLLALAISFSTEDYDHCCEDFAAYDGNNGFNSSKI